MSLISSVYLEYAIGLLLYAAVAALLEYFLAKLESPWPGRALMLLTLAVSLIFTVITLFYIQAPLGRLLFTLPSMLLALNLPTFAAYLVYWRARRRREEKKDVDKMNIQDL